MNGWNDGYITDIAYIDGWYRQQAPSLLALACVLNGVEAMAPAGDDPVQVLEIGCGQGYGALLLAAANPTWRITAVDFNPAHIAAARALAADARLENVAFLEADLATLAGEPAASLIPQADFVTLHGVWSWVSPAVKTGIVRLLRDKVRPGGVVHVSYNVLPSWGPRLGAQRLVSEIGRLAPGRSDRQVEQGLAFARELLATDAWTLREPQATAKILAQFGTLPVAYLAHEFMNGHWQPCFMRDVAEAFSGAKLEWVGSSALIENFPGLVLTGPQQALQQRFEDPLIRELIKDTCIERGLRHDVFVRGARRMTAAARDAALMALPIALTIRPADLPLEATVPAGKIELSPAFYSPVAEALADGPRCVGDLLNDERVQGRKDNPAELIGILVGLGYAEPVVRPLSGPGAAAVRFNQVAIREMVRANALDRRIGAASLRLGTGVTVSALELLVADQVRMGLADPARIAALAGLPDREPAIATAIEARVPVLRAAGLV